MSAPMWSGGPLQYQDKYPNTWMIFPDFMRAPFYPQDPPLSTLAMTLTCGAFMMVPVIGPISAHDLGEYQLYYADNFDTTPPASSTDTVPDTSAPTAWTPPASTDNYSVYQFGQLNDGILTILDYLGPWMAPDNLHVQIQAIEDALGIVTSGPVPTTAADTARILAALYYISKQLLLQPANFDDTPILDAIEAAVVDIDGGVDGVQTSVNTLHSAITGRFDTVDDSLSSLGSGHGSILDAIAAIEPSGGTDGAPVWPGLALVTIGAGVALSNGLHMTGAMDGVLISITTPPSKTGLMDIGGAMFDYREGQLAFETDKGEIETWQYLGFRQAIFTPRTMKRASGVRFRVLAGAEGLVYPWTVT